MYFKQFYLGCLAHASYLIGSDGEAAVVDPQRDIEQYITEANIHGLKIKYVIETHLHADFVSGHRELSTRTGAEIIFGANANATFPHRAVHDGDEIKLGNEILRILETPGHTPEGISILVENKILTGDTLFIGDVGRPDLAASKGFTAEQMAGMLYESLHEKILTLDDSIEVYPAHGAGSMCGRNISKETSSTIGEQRKFNYALKPMSKENFIKMMTTDLPEAPAYFSKDAEINRSGADALTDLPRPQELTPQEINVLANAGTLILDVRPATQFGAGHIPGAMNLGLGGQFASWAGSLIPLDTPIILVTEEITQVDEAVIRLARVGIETVKGYLSGGMYAWDQAGFPTATIAQMPVDELHEQLAEKANLQIVDVRRPAEYESGHIPTAINLELSHLQESLSQLDPNRATAVLCAGGYRSIAASSILARHGFKQIYNVIGGTSAWVNAGSQLISPDNVIAPFSLSPT